MKSLGIELLDQLAVQEVQIYADSKMHAHTAVKDKTGIAASNSNEPADKSSIPVIAPNGQVMLPVVGMSHPHASKVVAKQTAKRQQRLKRVGQTIVDP